MYVRMGLIPFADYCQVLLDGIPMMDCTAAHEEDGWVECYVRGLDGHTVVEGLGLKRQIHYGAVQILLSPAAPVSARRAFQAARHQGDAPPSCP